MSWYFCKHGFQKSRYIIITIIIIIIIIIITTTTKPFSQISPFSNNTSLSEEKVI